MSALIKNVQIRAQNAMRIAARRSLRHKLHVGYAQMLDNQNRPIVQVIYYRGHRQPWEFIHCRTHEYITTTMLAFLKIRAA